MAYHHKFSIEELENLSVFELEIYRDMIANDIAKKAAEAEGKEWAIG